MEVRELINAKDEKPKNTDYVLVYCLSPLYGEYRMLAYYEHKMWRDDDGGCFLENVVRYWMPIPDFP